MPLSSAAAAQVITTYQEATTIKTVGIVVAALLLYDVLLTSGQEYQYIWRSRKSRFSRALYVWNRYMYLLYSLLNLGTNTSMSNTSCTSLTWFNQVIVVLNLVGPAMFTTLRIYALSSRNKILSGMALVLSMAPFAINASGAYLKVAINLPSPLNCKYDNTASTSLNIGLVIASRGSLILVDSLAIAITWCQTRAAIKQRTGIMKRPFLDQVMRENGTVYFCTLVSMNVVDIILVILSVAIQRDQSSYILAFIDPISSILNSRFLLALHETNTRLEGAADASISSLTLDTGSSGADPQARSPELPEFLGVLGGSIRSFHQDNQDLHSLDFGQAEEHPSELEGDILEVRRD